jgi:hypothetical protein
MASTVASISEAMVRELEAQARSVKGEKARALKEKVERAERALARAEAASASPELIDSWTAFLWFSPRHHATSAPIPSAHITTRSAECDSSIA